MVDKNLIVTERYSLPYFEFGSGKPFVLLPGASMTSILDAKKLNCYYKVYEGYSHAVYDECPGFYDDVFANIR